MYHYNLIGVKKMGLLGVIIRNLIFYPLNELCDFDLIDEDPKLIEEKKPEEPLSNRFIEQYKRYKNY